MKKDALYRAFLNNKKKKDKEKKLLEKYNLSSDKVIINNKANTGLKFLTFLIDLFIKIAKFVLICAILILTTIGATVILNKELMNYIFSNIN